MRSADAERFASAFGRALAHELERKQMTQRAFASALGLDASYVNNTLSGRKPASPKWADMAADILKLNDRERQRLHHAAAIDAGFKLDLTKPERTGKSGPRRR